MTACLVVFGREPVPGQVKTRLARDIGAERAAAVYRLMLERTLAEAMTTGIPVVLSLAGALTGCWTPPEGPRVEVQGNGDLGRRMWDAFRLRFAEGADRALLIGSDCPGVTRAHLLKAIECLSDVPVVLGPAEDGGYWAIGQRAPGRDCFSGVPWSSGTTLQATRERLLLLDVEWVETETLADVDTAEDLYLLHGMVNG
ncbi:MAG: TIGR04282 family arsenosugar biosynthesis glycosyltransferase [Acidobacteriota bacterium]